MTTPDSPAAGPPAVAELLASVPLPVPEQAPAPDEKPARRSRSGTSGAERRRRAKEEAAGLPTTASGPANRATGDKPPAKGKPAAGGKGKAGTPTEHKALVEQLDKLLPYLALKDPYTAAVVDKRKAELAAAIFQVPLLSDLVRWASGLQAGASNPYVVLLTVALPILAHHGKLPAKLGMGVQLAGGFLDLEPSEEQQAEMQARGMLALVKFTEAAEALQAVATEAAEAKADAAA